MMICDDLEDDYKNFSLIPLKNTHFLIVRTTDFGGIKKIKFGN